MDARRLHVDEEGTDASRTTVGALGSSEDDTPGSVVGPARPELLAADHPLATVEAGSSAQGAEVAAGIGF
jgi:hypothetical protein